jgi:hypothetical protein
MEQRWNEIDRGKPKYSGKKPVPVPLCPPQILHGLILVLLKVNCHSFIVIFYIIIIIIIIIIIKHRGSEMPHSDSDAEESGFVISGFQRGVNEICALLGFT